MSVSPPVAPGVGQPVSKLKQMGRAVVAAVTSPTAVKEEKSLAVLVLTRLLLAAGASEGIVQLVQLVVKAA